MKWLSDKEIGTIIKKERVKKKLTQTELGKRIGVGAAAVQKWESGTVTNIKRNVLKRISEELEIHPGLLVGYDTSDSIIIDKSEIDVKRLENIIKFVKESE